MKAGLAVLFALLALASESLVSVLLAALAGWLLGGQQVLSRRLAQLEQAQRTRDSLAASRRAAAAPREPNDWPKPGLDPGERAEHRRPAESDADAGASAVAAAASNSTRRDSDTSVPDPAESTAARAAVAATSLPTSVAATDTQLTPESTAGADAQRTASRPPPLPPRIPPPQPARTASSASRARQGAPARQDTAALGARLKALLFGGNLPVKLGVLVLFVGVAAALRYAADQGWFTLPLWARFVGIAAAALAALGFALTQRRQRAAFSLSLQGGAIGVLLLCSFAAFRLDVMAAVPALACVVVLVALGAALAVWQNAAALALLGFLGGYLGPILINTGSGDQVALFTYYAALNAAVFAVAWWRHWHALNLIGFGFTFGVGSLWALREYTPEDYASSQFFLLLFWAFYLGIAVLGALRRGLAASHGVQASLSFALPLWAFALQSGLLEGDRDALAVAALMAAAVYAAIATLLLRQPRAQPQGQSFAWVAVGFATVAVPLAFSAQQTASVWALQAVGALWLGLRQQRLSTQVLSWLLQLGAAAAFLIGAAETLDAGSAAWEDARVGMRFSLGLLALAGFAASLVHERIAPSRLPVWLLFLLGSAWLALLWLHWVQAPPGTLRGATAALLGIAALAALAGGLRSLLRWPRLGWQVLLQLVLTPLLLVVIAVEEPEPLLRGQLGLGWIAAIGAGLFALRQLRQPPFAFAGLAHLALLTCVAGLLGVDFSRRAELAGLGQAWVYSLALLPTALLSFALWRLPRHAAWPLQDRFASYARAVFALALAALGLGWIGALYLPATATPLPYLPLLNPLELLQWGLLWLAWRALPRSHRTDLLPLHAALALAALLLCSQSLLRVLHHYAELPWSHRLFDSALTQGGLSVLWALAGVFAWVRGSRRGSYPLWLGGAVLMGVVLLKLLLVDRGYLGNLAGIGAVLTVGLLLVVVGYLAPSPPREGGSVDAEPGG